MYSNPLYLLDNPEEEKKKKRKKKRKKLRPTVNRPVYLGVGLQSGAHDQIYFSVLTIVGFLMCGALTDKRMDL
jgi:hypothetical protein